MKDFMDRDPHNKGAASQQQNKVSRQQDDTPVSVPDVTPAPAPVRRKPGRPKTKDIKHTCRSVNIMLPISLLDQWEQIKAVHGSNLTAYITKLMERDMQAKFEQYKKINNDLKNI